MEPDVTLVNSVIGNDLQVTVSSDPDELDVVDVPNVADAPVGSVSDIADESESMPTEVPKEEGDMVVIEENDAVPLDSDDDVVNGAAPTEGLIRRWTRKIVSWVRRVFTFRRR